MGNKKMKVKYYCGLHQGPLECPNCGMYEIMKCGSSGEIEVDDDAYEIGCAEAECPLCNSILEQGMGHFD